MGKTQMPVRSEYKLVETHAGAEFLFFIFSYLLFFLWDFDRRKAEIEKKEGKEINCYLHQETRTVWVFVSLFFFLMLTLLMFDVMLAQQWCSQRHVQGPTKWNFPIYFKILIK